LVSNATSAETTQATGLTAFGSTGFTVGALAKMNTSAATYVGWQWKAGGTAVSNAAGSITSSVSANTTAGFSVVTWTGNGSTGGVTLGHGLGVAPSMMILKSRSGTGNWLTYHASIGNTQGLFLDLTNAAATNSAYWNNTTPTSTVFTTTGNTGVSNQSGVTYVTYCFAPVAGYSAFGSYTGNGSADGPFVYLGFRARFVMLKASSTTGDWIVYDSSRNVYNVADLYLYPNSSAAEAGSGTPRIDFLSNGFKLRNTGQGNVSAVTFIYMAFAENPTKFSNAR
jgi:hypothetical protein